MTEKQARDFLYELWENGEIPSNFDENHTDYEKAVSYTIKHDQFNMELFLVSNIIINFGDWHVERDALVGKIGNGYIIECHRFWEIRDFNGFLVWDWLVHFTSKSWFTIDIVNDFNTAFFFCQDYFKENKPDKLPYVSTAQSLNIQKQILQIRKDMEKIDKSNKSGLFKLDAESLCNIRKLQNNITFL